MQDKHKKYMGLILNLGLFIGAFLAGMGWVQSDYLKECNERCDKLIGEYCETKQRTIQIIPLNISLNTTIGEVINSSIKNDN